MKTLNIILMCFLFGTLIMSCNKDEESANVSTVTDFPTFELIGPAVMVVEPGTSFEDPGVIATEAGVELPVTTKVLGTFTGNNTFDVNVRDIYTFTYSAVNADGFAGSTTRTVAVVVTGDLVNKISGLYTSTIVRNDVPKFKNLQFVFITDDNDDNTYDIEDGIGMYYCYGAGYGLDYSAPTTVTANDIPAGDFTYSAPFPVGAFGGNAVMSDMIANPEDKTLSWTTVWDAGYTFEVTLTQVQ